MLLEGGVYTKFVAQNGYIGGFLTQFFVDFCKESECNNGKINEKGNFRRISHFYPNLRFPDWTSSLKFINEMLHAQQNS